ncbi:MAG: nucleoside-diphosphate kinase [Candidatus Doudnabacteria bacterium Gr01-1014_77]|uniref:Nucleoside diphosphate kinase n=1 Tax=Candidatus Doudnabacteria bacterium Gr01-1014_77 TaxID=2017133 RepID=A0A554JE25_9BACT|nr:MAG: nucleoside-diphosphate kinase [Candidatus Doudnabacteria bacterium Gr01-1014_77]
MERTLVLLKPDAVSRGLVGEITQRFERVGLKIAGMKMVQPDETLAQRHYHDLGERKGADVLRVTVEMLVSGPVVAIVFEGVEAVELVRKMTGSTEPKAAAPGTIRGDYSHISFKHADVKKIGVKNLIHASGSVEDAEKEIPIWFTDEELIQHTPSYARHTLGE